MNVQEAYGIDKETDTSYWRDAIRKVTKNSRKAF